MFGWAKKIGRAARRSWRWVTRQEKRAAEVIRDLNDRREELERVYQIIETLYKGYRKFGKAKLRDALSALERDGWQVRGTEYYRHVVRWFRDRSEVG